MHNKVGRVMSSILSNKYDAKINIVFKELNDEKRRHNYGIGITDSNAGKRDKQIEENSRKD